MRISDWRSDVFSSDLGDAAIIGIAAADFEQSRPDRAPQRDLAIMTADILDQQTVQIDGCGGARIEPALHPRRPAPPAPIRRSEEHTSELQSLMRISYAVFCLKKKKHKHTPINLYT